MPKHSLKLDRKEDKHYYDICTELEQYGKSIIEEIDDKPWWKDLRIQIGRDAQKLSIKHDKEEIPVLFPPITNRVHRFGVVLIPKNVVVKEEKIGNTNSKFIFKII